MLQDAANQAERTDVRILDIVEVVASRLKSGQKQGEAEMRNEATGNESKDITARVTFAGVKFRYHENGGGLVAETAQVERTVHVGPRATVFGEAELKDYVQVTGRAQVGGSVKASGHVLFGGSVVVIEGTYEGHRIVHEK